MFVRQFSSVWLVFQIVYEYIWVLLECLLDFRVFKCFWVYVSVSNQKWEFMSVDKYFWVWGVNLSVSTWNVCQCVVSYVIVVVKNYASFSLVCIWNYRGKKALKRTSESIITKMLLRSKFPCLLRLAGCHILHNWAGGSNKQWVSLTVIYHLTATWRVFTRSVWS